MFFGVCVVVLEYQRKTMDLVYFGTCGVPIYGSSETVQLHFRFCMKNYFRQLYNPEEAVHELRADRTPSMTVKNNQEEL